MCVKATVRNWYKRNRAKAKVYDAAVHVVGDRGFEGSAHRVQFRIDRHVNWIRDATLTLELEPEQARHLLSALQGAVDYVHSHKPDPGSNGR